MQKDTNNNGGIQFKPITKGLGLNHFENGLPYAPDRVRRSRNPVTSTPVSAPAGTQPRPMVRFNFPETKKTVQAQPKVEAKIEQEVQHATITRRVSAFVIDTMLAAGLFFSIVSTSFNVSGYDMTAALRESGPVQVFWPLFLLYLVVHMGYFFVQEATWNRTLGKAMMGIAIQGKSTFAILGRAICFFLAIIPMGVGLLWYFFDKKNRCWHDVITETEVIVI